MSDNAKPTLLKRITAFVTQDLWQIRLRMLPRSRFWMLVPLKILLVSIRAFQHDRCAIRASALTFYSLLSIIPVVAMALGIAQGFGLGDNLAAFLTGTTGIHQQASSTADFDIALEIVPPSADRPTSPTLNATGPVVDEPSDSAPEEAEPAIPPWRPYLSIENLPEGQREAIFWIVQKADEFLKNTKSSLVAGIGTIMLLYIVIRLLSNVEESFNDIWKVRRGRTFLRKVSDYLAIAVITPLLLIIAGSLSVLIAKEIQDLGATFILLENITRILLRMLPAVVVWVVFALLFMLMPNTRVSWRAGILAGIFAGTLFQLVQWVYWELQIGAGRYNAIFGSLAALPLFLIWLQISWSIVFLGAEMSYAIDDEETYEPKRDYSNASRRFRMLLALRIVEICVKRFAHSEGPISDTDLFHELGAPMPLIKDDLAELVETGILTEVLHHGRPGEYYQPAQNIDLITIQSVISAMETLGDDSDQIIRKGQIDNLARCIEEMDRAAQSSPGNIPLKNL